MFFGQDKNLLSFVVGSDSLPRGCSNHVSPQGGVVEAYSEEVPHACLGGVVDDELVVEEGVATLLPHPRLLARAHRNSHAISERQREEGWRVEGERWGWRVRG